MEYIVYGITIILVIAALVIWNTRNRNGKH